MSDDGAWEGSWGGKGGKSEKTERKPKNGRRVKIAAVGLILLLEFGAFVYIDPGFFGVGGSSVSITFPTTSNTPTTTTKTSTKTTGPNGVQIESALIFNDTLSMEVVNNGTTWTKAVSVQYVCTPGFAGCYEYKGIAGKTLTKPFYLAPSGKYTENITKVCVVPKSPCGEYLPVANYTYYLGVQFSFSSGPSVSVLLPLKVNDTYPANSYIVGLGFTLYEFPNNETGRLNATVLADPGTSEAKYSGYLFEEGSKHAFNGLLITNSTRCGGKSNVTCTTALPLSYSFSMVQTGIGTPFVSLPFLFELRDVTNRTTFYFSVWVTSSNVNETTK